MIEDELSVELRRNILEQRLCIGTGVEVARLLLDALEADMNVSDGSRDAFGAEARTLRAWEQGASALLGATDGEEIDEAGDHSA